MNFLVFDIETIPNIALGRRIHGLADDLPDADVAKIMFFKQRQARGTDFLPTIQHQIVAISVALRSRDSFRLWSLGHDGVSEKDQVARFFEGLERYSPTIVSWNGSGFDLPVLHYRALHHGLSAAHYWDVGDDNRENRFNNYLGRFHWRHIDVMDVLAGYQHGAKASLEHTALSLGLPGKLGMSGAKVWDTYLAGDTAAIRNYCETDVLNTYLVYLRFELMRGKLDPVNYSTEVKRVRDWLAEAGQPHLQEFLDNWPG
jgi:predicted PolB exonuclease-like 3'-5' exonuclease